MRQQAKAAMFKRLIDKIKSATAPKVVRSYRIDPAVLKTAERLCMEQHQCGLSSIIEPLIITHFGTSKFEKDGK